MNILILGGGGREHALAWAVKQNPKCDHLIVSPGNAGMQNIAECVNLDINDGSAVVAYAKAQSIDFVIIGPEAPLVAGVANALRAAGILTFGPDQAAAKLEASKHFTKQVCEAAGAPTAAYGHFTDAASAKAFVKEQGAPIVVKADGLAAGKGVVVAMEVETALQAINDMFGGQFGQSGAEVVIEEFMDGEEASFFVLCDGTTVLPIGTAQDHKRVGEADTGPNTGGMGAYSPAPVVDEIIYQRIMDEVIYPTVRGMAAEGNDYTGFLYAGLMIMPDGTPKVIEYNCRFGDPETQPILLRLQSDLVSHCMAALEGALDQESTQWNPRPAIGVVLAAGGYPGSYRGGDEISGLSEISDSADKKVFHAGTSMSDGKIVTSGGRVLCATAIGDTVSEAQSYAYELASAIHWDNIYLRDDIGWRAIAREQGQ